MEQPHRARYAHSTTASSEIGPSALFQAYKLIKNGEKQGKSREDICSALREKFGEKNPEMQVLH